MVLLPNCTRFEGIVWDGLRGKSNIASHELASRIESGVLLTAPQEINASVSPFVYTADEIAWRSGLAVSLALAAIAVPWAVGKIAKRLTRFTMAEQTQVA